MVVLTKFVNWQPVQKGCLNTPGLFSLGGELHLFFFFFSLKKSPQNLTTFSSFWGEWKCSPRFRTAKSYFCNEKFQRNWPMATASITKSKDKTQDQFCCLPQKAQSTRGWVDTFTFWVRCFQLPIRTFPGLRFLPVEFLPSPFSLTIPEFSGSSLWLL